MDRHHVLRFMKNTAKTCSRRAAAMNARVTTG
jgi:hypothetical protein